MKVLQKSIVVKEEKYYTTHLHIINEFLPTKITETEIQVLGNFMALDESIIAEDMFNTVARKKVKDKLNNMSSASLSNHLKSLIDKGYINKNEITNKLSIIPGLFPNKILQGYQFKIVNGGQ